MPGATCTCTSTGRTSMPANATVATRWTIFAYLAPGVLNPSAQTAYERSFQPSATIAGVGLARKNNP
jgi:hypothetical protein